MMYKGYDLVKESGGWDIMRGGVFVAWTAGSLSDAEELVDMMPSNKEVQT